MTVAEDIRTVETTITEVRAAPDALLSDAVLDFACSLDEVTFQRLKMTLSAVAKTAHLHGFVAAVKARAKERKVAQSSEQRPAHRADDRPQIVITIEEGAVNDQAAEALRRIPGLYSRMGELVRVIESKRRRPGEDAPYEVMDIKLVTEPLLREWFTRCARWLIEDPPGSTIMVPAHPPEWSSKQVYAWKSWPTVKPLYHLSEYPVLLHDGRVIQRPGYDMATGILCTSKIEVDVPATLTREDAANASAILLGLVSQVPFDNAAHRSAWLAALLTVVARWAFRGQCPLFMFDANKEGTGKGFLVDIISGIVLGRPCDFFVQTADEDEERKRITSKVLTAQPLVLIDEVDKPFGSGAIQGLLTTGVWSDRLLGGNEAPSHDAYIVWFGAGNNVQMKSGDIARRTCFVRIVTALDNPAERTGFDIDDMDSHVAKHRGELFRAALIMLRAWLLSGVKVTELEGWGGRWGSFDDWDRVVRGAIVYAGLTDPKGAKATAVAPTTKEGMVDLVLGLEEAAASIGLLGEIGSSAICDAMADNDTLRKDARQYGSSMPMPPITFQRLRKGIHSLLPHLKGNTPSGHQFGVLLGKSQAQAVHDPSGGKRKWIKYRHVETGGLWRVDAVGDVPAIDDDAESSAAREV